MLINASLDTLIAKMNANATPKVEFSTTELPKQFDWRERGAVTRIKNQGTCGSCWAFSSIATIESAHVIQNELTKSDLIELSEQQLVDCVNYPEFEYTDGCNGGQSWDAYEYVLKYGIVKEENYPYLDRVSVSQLGY